MGTRFKVEEYGQVVTADNARRRMQKVDVADATRLGIERALHKQWTELFS
jgi:hypothetical protein